MSSINENQSETDPLKKNHEETKIGEEILKPKYPHSFRAPSGPSDFLQKRLQKGQKYFDSADYQMAKQNSGNILKVVNNQVTSTGEKIPTPETVPERKMMYLQSDNKYQTQK